jgi:TRAP-type C4-dicarboxylate transport system permease small subunit
MQLRNQGKNLERVIVSITRVMGYVGCAVMVAMMLLTVVDVFLRRVLNRPILGSLEITEYMMVSLSFLVIAWATLEKRHVLVDVVFSRLPPRLQARFNIVLYILCLLLYGLIAWQSIPEALFNMRFDERSIVLGMPIFPAFFIVSIGCAMVSLVLLVHVAKLINEEIRQ